MIASNIDNKIRNNCCVDYDYAELSAFIAPIWESPLKLVARDNET